jgi:hypothetical protein
LAIRIKRRNGLEIGRQQFMQRPVPSRRPHPLDALMPFAAAARFGPGKVIAAGAGVGIDDAKGRGLLAQMQQHAGEHAVLVNVGKTAGMKGVAIIHHAKPRLPLANPLRCVEARLQRSLL